MIEAVNSVLSNAPLVRTPAGQQSTAQSYAANPEKVQEVAQAPYISPYISVDVNLNKAVLQIRDSQTGDVVRTIPSQTQLEAYRRAQAQQVESNTEHVSVGGDSSTGGAAVQSEPVTAPQVSSPAPSSAAPAPAQQTVSVDTQA